MYWTVDGWSLNICMMCLKLSWLILYFSSCNVRLYYSLSVIHILAEVIEFRSRKIYHRFQITFIFCIWQTLTGETRDNTNTHSTLSTPGKALISWTEKKKRIIGKTLEIPAVTIHFRWLNPAFWNVSFPAEWHLLCYTASDPLTSMLH